ncbi:MAG: Vps62-related protein [Desulfobacteraceae bacterium]|nr:Vps62-related protein [Desulfobacteraceae bacterium]
MQQFGDLEIAFTDEFQKTWSDKGSGAEKDGSFWHPLPPPGFHVLGSIGVNHQGEVNRSIAAMCVKDISDKRDALHSPKDFVHIWDDQGSGATSSGSCWRPIPPDGYVALGDVFVAGYGKPQVSLIMCVREDLTHPATVGSIIWTDKGSNVPRDFRAFDISTYRAASDTKKGLFAPQTFVGNSNEHKPQVSEVLNCLHLEFPVDRKEEDIKAPDMKNKHKPPNVMGNRVDHTVYVPFTAILDPEYPIHWQVHKSPIYRVERHTAFTLEIYDYNDTSVDQKFEKSITIGTSKASTEAFKASAGISVTTEGGVSIAGVSGKVSGTITAELGWEQTKTTSYFTETTDTYPVVVPPKTAVAVWVVTYTIVIRRADNTVVPGQVSFKGDYITQTQFPRPI